MSVSDWQDCIITNPNFACGKCSGKNIRYYVWESSDGAYEDKHYQCKDCKYDWWVESADY